MHWHPSSIIRNLLLREVIWDRDLPKIIVLSLCSFFLFICHSVHHANLNNVLEKVTGTPLDTEGHLEQRPVLWPAETRHQFAALCIQPPKLLEWWWSEEGDRKGGGNNSYFKAKHQKRSRVERENENIISWFHKVYTSFKYEIKWENQDLERPGWHSKYTFRLCFDMNCVSQNFPTAWFHVVSVQGSGLMQLLPKLLSGRDWFWSLSWKMLPRLTSPVFLFSCLALWSDSPCHSCFILIVEKMQRSPVFSATVEWSCTCSLVCHPAVHIWKQKKAGLVWPWSLKTQEPLPVMTLYQPSSGSATALFVFTAKALYAYF